MAKPGPQQPRITSISGGKRGVPLRNISFVVNPGLQCARSAWTFFYPYGLLIRSAVSSLGEVYPGAGRRGPDIQTKSRKARRAGLYYCIKIIRIFNPEVTNTNLKVVKVEHNSNATRKAVLTADNESPSAMERAKVRSSSASTQ